MGMHLIYRIQDRRGRGVFSSGLIGRLSATQSKNAYGHPAPADDREMGPEGDYPLCSRSPDHRFGFLTLEQGRSWFGQGACETLTANGGLLAVYRREKVRDLIKGRFQCVFIPRGVSITLPTSALHWSKAAIEERVINRTYAGQLVEA